MENYEQGQIMILIVGASYCRAQTLECWLSSCGARAQLLLSMWDLSGPRIKPVSLALTGVFFTTGPPGKSHAYISGENFPGWWQRSTWTWKITKQHNYLYTSSQLESCQLGIKSEKQQGKLNRYKLQPPAQPFPKGFVKYR